jgi:group I intron endonuclease
MSKSSTTSPVIYGLVCICHPNNPIRYVGQTSQGLSVRFRDHRQSAAQGPDHRVGWLPVYRWMRKHGIENIQPVVLEIVPLGSDIDAREVYWIDKLGTFAANGGLNMTLGGAGQRGFNHSEETKQRIAQKRRNTAGLSKAGINADIVTEIKFRLWSGETVKETADFYGLTAKTVKDINQDKCWRHVPWPIGPRERMRTSELRARNMNARERDELGRMR